MSNIVSEEYRPILIIGAGPAGLTAAYELVKLELRPCVLEKGKMVGGLARTEHYKGYRFDIGGRVGNMRSFFQKASPDFLLASPGVVW